MPIERLKPKFSFVEDRIKELKIIAPESFTDGKINWDTLKDSFEENIESTSNEMEHFGLFWPGKKDARRMAANPFQGTLVPIFGEGLKTDGTLILPKIQTTGLVEKTSKFTSTYEKDKKSIYRGV